MKWFLNAGLTDKTPVKERHKVFLLNRLIFVTLVINLTIFVIDIILGVYVNALANLAFVVIYYPLFYLHHRGKYALARGVFIIAINAFIVTMTLATYHQDRWTETENILFASIAGIVFLYDKRYRVYLLAILTIVLFGLKFYKFLYFSVPVDTNFILTIVNSSIAITAIYFFSSAFQKEFTEALDRTVRLNDSLNQQKMVLEENEKRLSELNKAKNKLFSIVAHDLKSPINLLNSLLYYSNSENFDKDELNRYNAKVRENMNMVNHMLDNVLIWAKSQLDGYSLFMGEYKLKNVMEEVLTFYLDTIKAKKLNVSTNIDPQHKIVTDINLLRIVMRNIVSNAIKYTNENGAISISSEEQRDFIYLYIEDNGTGISEDTLRRILNQDLIDSIDGTEGERGTGLGLILSLEMLRLSDADLCIESKLGVGTKMEIKLPTPVSHKVKIEQ